MHKHGINGFALPVVILVSAVILLSVVTATVVSALGSRVGSANERVAYQALLSAESGINSFAVRAKEYSYTGTYTKDDLNSWLTTNGINTLSLGDNTTTITVVDAQPATNTFTVQATSSLGNGQGSKLVLADFKSDIFSGNLGLSAPAALVSLPAISINGNATINGLTSSEADWIFAVGTTTNSATTNASGFSLTVQPSVATAVTRGGYVEINNTRYHIDGVDTSSNSLTLSPATSVFPLTIASGSSVNYVPFAVSQEVTSADSVGVSTVSVTNADQFRVSDTIYMGNYSGRVQGISEDSLAVKWSGLTPSSSAKIPPGTTIRREVLGGISEGSIDPGSSTNSGIFPDYQQYADLPNPDGTPNEFFTSVFGITVEQMQQAAAIQGHLYDSWKGVSDIENLSGVTYVKSGTNTNIQYCGSGILIVEGNLKTNNASCKFTGLIYVTGDWFEKGNRQITGSVIVEGNLRTEVCSDNTTSSQQCNTDVNGTNDKIHYSPTALLKAGENITYALGTFSQVPGTWRQK